MSPAQGSYGMPGSELGESQTPTIIDAPRMTVVQPAAQASPTAVSTEADSRTLGEILTTTSLEQLGYSKTDAQITWQDGDKKLLALTGSENRFDLRPIRMRGLGTITWEVSVRPIASDASVYTRAEKYMINGTARAWQSQVIVVRPLAMGAIIARQDVNERRVLVEQLDPEVISRRDAVVGMQAARNIDVGSVLTARNIQQVPLAKTGQPIAVEVDTGGIMVRQTMKALEGGGMGQTIRVRNEQSKQVISVRLIGPQQAVVDQPGFSPGSSAGGAEDPAANQ
jgi:flagella basal body P-ring formation protein FlgA